MGCTKGLIFFLLQFTAVFSTEETSISSLSSYFEVRENKQLKGFVVKRFDSPSLLSCGQQCMRYLWCTSTNYKMSPKKDDKGTCELNKHDISIINENTNFQNQQGVTFSILQKGCLFTSCFHGGTCLPDKEKKAFSCLCLPPWTGDRCEARLGCQQGWVLHGNSCYHVIYTPAIKWNEARKMCQDLGEDLAIIRSQDENKFILELLNNTKMVHIESAWLGLKRKWSAGNPFYWIDDTPLVGHFSAWANGEPNDSREECVQIIAASNNRGKWNDKKCIVPVSEKNRAPVALCQKRLMR